MTVLIDERMTFAVVAETVGDIAASTRASLQYGRGARILAVVAYDGAKEPLDGIGVFATLADAIDDHGAPVDAVIVKVEPARALAAVQDALQHGTRLVIVLSEGIPSRDVARMIELAERAGTRIVGPGSLGVIVPGFVKVGAVGGHARATSTVFTPGPVGLISRSGGMTTELCAQLSAAGLGQSTAVSIGGDAMVGTTFAELMPAFEEDPATSAVVVYTEPGGDMDAQLADWAAATVHRLPIVAFVAGRSLPERSNARFGHAGTLVEGKGHSAADKVACLELAGIVVVDELSSIQRAVGQAIGVAAPAL